MNLDSTFLDYVSTEERNLLTSLVRFDRNLESFTALDSAFRNQPKRGRLTEADSILIGLYLFVHSQFYFSIVTLLRGHLSDSVGSIRKSIDATLSAYRILHDPESQKDYLDSTRDFQNVKAFVGRNLADFPLAQHLVVIHEVSSKHGPHADAAVLAAKLAFDDGGEGAKPQVKLRYFQIPDDPEEYEFQLVNTLYSYYLMFVVFKDRFFDERFKVFAPQWDKDSVVLERTLRRRGEYFMRRRGHIKE